MTLYVCEFEGITKKAEEICTASPHTCSRDVEVFVQYEKTSRSSEVKLRFWGQNPRCVSLLLTRKAQRKKSESLCEQDEESNDEQNRIITTLPSGFQALCFISCFWRGVESRMVRIRYLPGGEVQTGRDNHTERKEMLMLSMISSERTIIEDKKLLACWFQECYAAAVISPVDVVEIYGLQQASKEWTPEWHLERTRLLKNTESVGDRFYLERKVSKEIFFDARLWSTSSLRIYLVVGPPGVGKSEFIVWLAGQLRLPLYRLSLYSSQLTDEVLAQVLSHSWLKHDSAVIQLDEFQSVLTRWGSKQPNNARKAGGITAAGLCEVLQGATSLSRGVIILSGTEELLSPHLHAQYPALYRRFVRDVRLTWLQESDIRLY